MLSPKEDINDAHCKAQGISEVSEKEDREDFYEEIKILPFNMTLALVS